MATTIEVKPETATLSNDEILRYSRHLIMPEVGMEGQQKLKAAKVLCIGAGGLGSPLALYLTAAGVGTLGIVDYDVVDYTNLQRQIIHTTADVGRKKLDSAAAGPGSFLRRRRSARHSPRTGRRDSGDRDHQADSGAGRFARRTIAAGRCARHEVPRTEAAQESRLPRLRHAPDDHKADRLRRVLRNPRCGSARGGRWRPARDFGGRIEKEVRRQGRHFYSRRARAARISDL